MKNIDYSDIQGLIRFAHGHLNSACFLLLHIRDVNLAAQWVLQAPVTSAETHESKPERVLQISFTSLGLQALKLPETVIEQFSEEFISGMSSDANRSRRLGDLGSNSPENWQWGRHEKAATESERATPHLLLMIYAREGDLDAWKEAVKGDAFEQAFRIQDCLHTTSLGPKEPFGFDDGISQPKVDWQRKVSTDLHERDSYSNLLALGEILLGYPNEYGLYTNRPLIDPAEDSLAETLNHAEDKPALKDLGHNGSYLVFRQLAQDVVGFWRSIDAAVNHDSEQREQLAAAMVGRHRDGRPLVSPSKKPIQGIVDKGAQFKKNHFTYDDDPHGQQCPIGSHVRRSNPRTGDFPVGVTGFISRFIRIFGFCRRHPHDDVIASTRFHRLLRRGRSYGPALLPEDALKADLAEDIANQERGLHFVSLGANISRQFEFVQAAWNMSPKFGGLSTERDPVIGHREPLPNGESSDNFTLPQASGPTQCIKNLPQFVKVVGGAYFFMPSLKALKYIAQQAIASDQS